MKLIIIRSSKPGESGSIFYDEYGDAFVLSGVFSVESSSVFYEKLGLPVGKVLTTLTPLGFNINYHRKD